MKTTTIDLAKNIANEEKVTFYATIEDYCGFVSVTVGDDSTGADVAVKARGFYPGSKEEWMAYLADEVKDKLVEIGVIEVSEEGLEELKLV